MAATDNILGIDCILAVSVLQIQKIQNMGKGKKATTVEPTFEQEWNDSIHWLNHDEEEPSWHTEETHAYTDDFDVDNLLSTIQIFQYRNSGNLLKSNQHTFILLNSANGMIYLIAKSEWNISIEYSASQDRLLSKMGKNGRLRPHAKPILQDQVEPNFTFETMFELFLDVERERGYDANSDNGQHFAQRVFNGCAVQERCEIVENDEPVVFRDTY